MGKPLPKRTVSRIGTLAAEGIGAKDIAAKVKISPAHVRQVLLRNGLSHITEDFLPARTIAAGLGVGIGSMHAWLHHGWLFRTLRPDPPKAGTRWRVTEDHVFAFLADPVFWIEWDIAPITNRLWRDWAIECRRHEPARYHVRDLAARFAMSQGGVLWILRRDGIRPAAASRRRGNFYDETAIDALAAHLRI